MTFRNNKICYGKSLCCTNIGKKIPRFFYVLTIYSYVCKLRIYVYIVCLDKDDFYKYTYIIKFFIFLHMYLFLSTFFNCYIFTLQTHLYIYTLVFITRDIDKYIKENIFFYFNILMNFEQF